MILKKTKKLTYRLINKKSGKDNFKNNQIVVLFLKQHLEVYGDKIEDIEKAINYVFDKEGGFILVQLIEQEITGVVVVNETGMKGYIPENILVYIAVNNKHRGKGYGKELMKNAIKLCDGDIALHVEKDNPAIFLYEKMGFTKPYLEMRLKR
jgi:ribosomal-protein-alanine N-acetyltransferase